MDGFKGKQPENVLIARLSALTDIIVSIPVVYSACYNNPDVHFIYITKSSTESLFINAPQNLTVIGIDIKGAYSGLSGVIRLFDYLRSNYAIDTFIDLNDVWQTRILGMLYKMHGIAVRKINNGLNHKRALTRKHNKVMLPLVSQQARYQEVFFRAGISVDECFTSLFGKEKGDPKIFSSISSAKIPGEKWIGIAPFAKHRGKIYPLELTEKIVSEINRWENTRIFLFGGGEDECHILNGWTQKYANSTSLADKRYGFPLELALLSHLDVMVSMDSANMHLASISGVPVVSIWGATHPYCGFNGWKQSEANTVQLSMVCRPCSMFGDKPCHNGDYHCLAGIPTQAIIDKIKHLLNA